MVQHLLHCFPLKRKSKYVKEEVLLKLKILLPLEKFLYEETDMTHTH
jgi:hypothetical protein